MATATTNRNIESVGAPAGAVGQDITHVSIWSASTGGDLLAQGAITNNPDAFELGEKARILSGWVMFRQNSGTGETDELQERKLAGAIGTGVYVQWHTGAPGAAGTSNVASISRTQIPSAAVTIA